jgi:hypothetical protein
VNAGAVRNTGFEFGATFSAVDRSDLQLNTSLNLTTTRNRVLSLGNGAQPIFVNVEGFNVTRTAVGGPIGAFYVRDMVGIFQSQAEIDAYTATVNGQTVKIQGDAKPGDVKYRDINGDGAITDADRYNAGSGIPTLQGGFFVDGRFRRFDFVRRGCRARTAPRCSTSRAGGPTASTTPRTTAPTSGRGRPRTRAAPRRAR